MFYFLLYLCLLGCLRLAWCERDSLILLSTELTEWEACILGGNFPASRPNILAGFFSRAFYLGSLKLDSLEIIGDALQEAEIFNREVIGYKNMVFYRSMVIGLLSSIVPLVIGQVRLASSDMLLILVQLVFPISGFLLAPSGWLDKEIGYQWVKDVVMLRGNSAVNSTGLTFQRLKVEAKRENLKKKQYLRIVTDLWVFLELCQGATMAMVFFCLYRDIF